MSSRMTEKNIIIVGLVMQAVQVSVGLLFFFF